MGDMVQGLGGVVAFEGRDTSDGRRIIPGALAWATPLPIRRARADAPCGHVTVVYRDADEDDGSTAIVAGGLVDTTVPPGQYKVGLLIAPSKSTGPASGPGRITHQAQIVSLTLYDAGSDHVPAWADCEVVVTEPAHE